MIFFDSEQNIKKDSDLYKYLHNTLQNLYKQLDLQKNKRKNLITWINKIEDICVCDFKNIDTTNLLSNIDSIKNNLDNISTNIEDINTLITSLKNIISNIDNNINTENINLSEYFTLYMENQNNISEKNLKIEALYGKIYECSHFNNSLIEEEKSTDSNNEINLSAEKEAFNTNKIENENNKDFEDSKNNYTKKLNTKENFSNSKKNNELSDNNTLIISETQNKVFLPYKISDLELVLKENSDKYNSLEDLINKDYIIPLSKYKNSSLARFREAFILMKHKEKASFAKALDLALELVFKYNLNPAVISACKNLDELDIYLDCLEDMQLNDFKIFDIKYEISPMKV